METNPKQVWVIAKGTKDRSQGVLAITSDLHIEEVESIAREIIEEIYPEVQEVTLEDQWSMGNGKALCFTITYKPLATVLITHVWAFSMTLLK